MDRTSRPHPRAPAVAGLTALQAGQGLCAAPFDALRLQYAFAVMAGLLQGSLLASAQLERWLDRLEHLVLGPLARSR